MAMIVVGMTAERTTRGKTEERIKGNGGIFVREAMVTTGQKAVKGTAAMEMGTRAM